MCVLTSNAHTRPHGQAEWSLIGPHFTWQGLIGQITSESELCAQLKQYAFEGLYFAQSDIAAVVVMASGYRADKSGFAREVQARIMEKYDAEEAAKALRWIRLLKPANSLPESLTTAVEKIPQDISTVSADDFYKYLKDGLVLGYLIGCLRPDEVSKNLGKAMWTVSDKAIFETNRQRERIGAFIDFCQKMGVASASAFQTDQLHEQTNLPQVVICLSQLGVEAQAKPDYTGPQGYWMQRHQENRRTFTKEQLKAGESVIGLQMGYTGGANQSGISFGAQRKVTDMF